MIKDKIVLMLMGPSGCGKSTLEKGLCEHEGVHKAISATTRPAREGEKDGVDYHFVTVERFRELQSRQELVQTTEFGGNLYGSSASEYTTTDNIVTLVVTPSSAKAFKYSLDAMFYNIRTMFVYFDISEERLIQNMIARGDTNEMIVERLAQDDLKQQFNETGIVPDYVITDDKLNENTLANVCLWLAKQPEINNNG
jgi:guanylate kinase